MHTSYQNFAVVKKEICFNDIHGNKGKEKFNLIFISVLFSLLLMWHLTRQDYKALSLI